MDGMILGTLWYVSSAPGVDAVGTISKPHMSSTTLIQHPLFSAANHPSFDVTCVRGATVIAHHWQKTCPKALSIANIY
jgi:hypothetical protein